MAALFALALLGPTACDGKSGGAGPAANMHTVTLTTIDNLKVDIFENYEPKIMGEYVEVATITEYFLVQRATSLDAKTLEEAKKSVTNTLSGTNLVEEVLADGWALTFENPKKWYGLWVRRKIGETEYFCYSHSTEKKERRDGGLTACKTLRK